jgi:hypothetical protein
MTTLVDAVLVHGSILVPGSSDPTAPYDHAWVVLADGHVWDPTQARLWNARLFWCVMQPVVASTYTHTQLRRRHHARRPLEPLAVARPGYPATREPPRGAMPLREHKTPARGRAMASCTFIPRLARREAP